MAVSRHQVLIRSEVARWKALEPPYGASQDEVEACRARRADYADRLTAGVAMLVEREGFLSALGRVLGRVRGAPPNMGLPEVSTLVHQVVEDLDARARAGTAKDPGSAPRCSRCEREQGIVLYGRQYPPQRATVVPEQVMRDEDGRARPAVCEPLCTDHLELTAWEARRARGCQLYPPPRWTQPLSTAGRAAAEQWLRVKDPQRVVDALAARCGGGYG